MKQRLFALNIVGFPSDKLDLSILSNILQGGIDKCNSANIQILGGHSIKDDVPKYGLAVTGLIDNEKIITNNNANEGDDIILKWDGNLLYSKKEMFPLKNINFNGYDLYIPNNSKEILRQTYGDNYMIPIKKSSYSW